jgi:hypothetical protein
MSEQSRVLRKGKRVTVGTIAETWRRAARPPMLHQSPSVSPGVPQSRDAAPLRKHPVIVRYCEPREDAVLHTRLTLLAVDTAALDACISYIEQEIGPALERRPGSLGISVLEDRERGVAIFGSVWATSGEMNGSENTEAPLRAELAGRAGGPLTVEEYQVPVFELVEQLALPQRGLAAQLTRIQVKPSQVDDAIEVVGDYAVPSLVQAPGFCDALLFADGSSGRLISETIWRDPRARRAAPSVATIVRTEMPDAEVPDEVTGDTSAKIRDVEDYTLVFSTVREP